VATGKARSPIVQSRVDGRASAEVDDVDQGFEQRAVERQPDRPALVHQDTGILGRRACTLFAVAHEASADGEAAV